MIYHQTEEGLGHLLITWAEEDDTQSFRYYKLGRDYLEDLRRKKGLTAGRAVRTKTSSNSINKSIRESGFGWIADQTKTG